MRIGLRIEGMEKGREGLVQKEVEVKRNGKTFKQKRWVRPGDDTGKPKGPALGLPAKKDKKSSSENTEFKTGDQASGIDVNGDTVSGTVTGIGGSGITIDHQFHVEYAKAKKGGQKKTSPADTKNSAKTKSKDNQPADAKKQLTLKEFDNLPYKAAMIFDLGNGKYNVRTNEKNPTTKGFPHFDAAVQNALNLVGGDKSVIFGIKSSGSKKADPVFIEGEEKLQGKEKKKKYIDPANFNAADFAKQWDDPKATADETGKEYILESFGAEGETIANAIRDTDSRNQRIIDDKQLTHQKYRISGQGESARYTPEREKLHGEIMQELLSPDKLRTALPPLGQKPKFIILGGRGGSGKSWFKDNLYDPSSTVILDADEIKEKLPEYKGWNANQVHEESSDILEQMLAMCIRNGLNVVLDATMKTADSALAKVFRFKSADYKTEAHYMHLPKQEAAKRAIGRFKGEPEKDKEDEYKPYGGRYVPVTAVLKNTTNEESFDQVRKIVDEWSFRDSQDGFPPTLISEGKKEIKKSFAALVRAKIQGYI